MNQNDVIGIPADAEQRVFTGIWIPAELWLDDQVPPLAKLLYAEIASFKNGCWKKSEDLMRPLNIKSGLFQQLCKILRERGYISEQRKFGRIVRTSTLGFSSPQKTHQCEKRGVHHRVKPLDEQAESCGVHIEYKKDIYSSNIRDENITPVENFGRTDINELVDLWQSETGISIKGQQNQRRQLYNLVRKNGFDETKQIIKRVGAAIKSGDQYAPRIATPSDLTGKFGKLPKLELWENLKKYSRKFGQGSTTPAPSMATMNLKKGIPDYNGAWTDQTEDEHDKVSQLMKETRQKLKL